jgi:uncharacterized membrane protein
MPDSEHQLVAISFFDAEPASRLVEAAQRLEDNGDLDVIDLVVLRSGEDGSVRIDDHLDPSPTTAAGRGALAGLVLGALVELPIAGLAIGAIGSALLARKTDFGMPQEFVDELRDHLGPRRIVVAILAEVHAAEAVLQALEPISDGAVVAGNLSAEATNAINDAIAGFQFDDLPIEPRGQPG